MNELNLTYEDLMDKNHNAKKQGNVALSVSNECLNCGDERIKKKIQSAFKMACINYAPSPVIFRGKKYERRSLIEAKRTMLD